MPQFRQIRERFLANARQYLLDTETITCNCPIDCCRNSPASSTSENTPRLGKKED